MTARVAIAALTSYVLLALLLAALGWPGRSYWNGDHLIFWAGSRAVLAGVSPYEEAWWESLPEREGRPEIALPFRPSSGPAVTTAYPLWTFIVFAPFGALPYDLAAAAWLTAQLAIVACGLAVLALALLERPRRDLPVIAGIAAGFQPMWILVGNGNITGFLFGAVAGGLTALISGRPFLAGSLLGLLALKPHPFALLPLVVLFGAAQPAKVVAGSVTTLGVLAALSFAVRPGWVGEWLPQLAAARTAGLSNATGATLDRIFATPLAPALAITLAVIAFIAWWRSPRPGLVAVFAGAIAVSLFIAPYGWSYDHLHLLIIAVVVVASLPGGGRLRIAGLVLLAIVAGLVPWVLYAVAFSRGGEELSAVIPLLFFMLLVTVVADPRSRQTAR